MGPPKSMGPWVIVPPAPLSVALVHVDVVRTVTFMRGRLGSGRLGAADYAPGLLGAETFRRQR